MAKGQKRSGREPKKPKATAKTVASSQLDAGRFPIKPSAKGAGK